MSAVQQLLDALLWDIYGKVSTRGNLSKSTTRNREQQSYGNGSWKYSEELLKKQSIYTLTEICASLRIEIRIIGSYLTRVLIGRDKNRQKQQVLCNIITAYLKALSQPSADAKNMRFSLSPPHLPLGGGGAGGVGAASTTSSFREQINDPNSKTDESTSSSDFDEWLHAMKMVARLPGGMPPEFRKKLWLALSEKYLQNRNVDWEKEQTKCFSEQWREDDEELGIQIVKDLHRTGSSLCSGPAGSINQAKLKRILLGYARWNPEVGYCQGFNMLGALILQVMDKNEVESMKVMIFLVEGVLPPGYFSGSLGGLQADMAVFRELMTSKLPKLAKHLQRLQGRMGEDSFEPPLTNVFTMQWFLTLFCTCLPINCVLRVWDLVLIEGSDVLLRTALAIWSILEDKILCAKTADDFYCKMGMLSGELLNGHLIDSNGLIERVVDLGPVPELQKLRDKHLYNIAPWRDKKGLRLYYSDEEGDSDDDSRLAVTAAWGLRINRRGSVGLPSSSKGPVDNKDRIALDISLLKKQYDRLRERQRQAHIILTAAVARQGVNPTPSSSLQMNQLLMGRNAIVTNKGRRIGPPQGAIPPARKVSSVASGIVTLGGRQQIGLTSKQTKRGETLHWRDTEAAKRRKNSMKWKDNDDVSSSSSYVDSDNAAIKSNVFRRTTTTTTATATPKTRTTTTATTSTSAATTSTTLPRSRKKSESSSYSEDSDANSSTSTSLCDEDDNENPDTTTCSSLEASPLRKIKTPEIEVPEKDNELKEISKCVKSLDDIPINNDDKIDRDDDNDDSDKGKENLDSTIKIGQISVIDLTDLPKNLMESYATTTTTTTNTITGTTTIITTTITTMTTSTILTATEPCITTATTTTTTATIELAVDEDSSTECDRFGKTVFSPATRTIDYPVTYSLSTISSATVAKTTTSAGTGTTSAAAATTTASTILKSLKVKKEENEEKLPSLSLIDNIIKKNVSSSASLRVSFSSSSTVKAIDYLDVSKSPLTAITSTSQLSPIADISKYLSSSSISPLKTPTTFFAYTNLLSSDTKDDDDDDDGDGDDEDEDDIGKFDVSDEGVTNEYFERINLVERPNHLDLFYSLNDDKDLEYGIKIKSISTPLELKSEKVSSPFIDVIDEKQIILTEAAAAASTTTTTAIEDTTTARPTTSSTTTTTSIKPTTKKVNDIEIDESPMHSSAIHSPSILNTFELLSPPPPPQPPLKDNSFILSTDYKNIINSCDNDDEILHAVIEPEEDYLLKHHLPPPPPSDDSEILPIITECRASSSIGSIFPHSISKEKSFSFDLSSTVEKQELRPTSCPEARANIVVESKAHSERVLKIIEENSLILHRILRKSIPHDSPIDNKENYTNIKEMLTTRITTTTTTPHRPDDDDDDDDDNDVNKFLMKKDKYDFENSIEFIEKSRKYNLDADLPKTPKNSPCTDLYSIMDFSKKDYDISPFKKRDQIDSSSPIRSRPHSRILDLSNIQLRSDDNIADRLASIKNTIKSIDSLCEEKEPLRKDKCQRYIDSLFNNNNNSNLKEDSTSVSNILSPPSIKIDDTIMRSSTDDILKKDLISGLNNMDTNISYLTDEAHFNRSYKREISPRRRRDEDREEYESRVRRDKMPKYIYSSEVSEGNGYSTSNAFSKISHLDDYSPTTDSKDYFTKISPPPPPPSSSVINASNESERISDISSFTNRNVKGSTFDIQSSVPTVYVPAKLELRHTTVTSTFYDRYLSQKRERIAKAEKSPQSSTISLIPQSSSLSSSYNSSFSYMNTLKPNISLTMRNSKSAENSPSRKKNETSPPSTIGNHHLHHHYHSRTSYKQSEEDEDNLYVKSCDNILLKLKTSSSTSNSAMITTTSTITTTTTSPMSSTSPSSYFLLPLKPKKPTEMGIQLGLYKNLTESEDSKS